MSAIPVGPASNGTGSGGGIGSGTGGGVGSGTGPGVGPGSRRRHWRRRIPRRWRRFGTRALWILPILNTPKKRARRSIRERVVLWLIVGPDGKPRDIKVARALGMGLDQKAIEAVTQLEVRAGHEGRQASRGADQRRGEFPAVLEFADAKGVNRSPIRRKATEKLPGFRLCKVAADGAKNEGGAY